MKTVVFLRSYSAAWLMTIILAATLISFAQEEKVRNWAPGSRELIQPEDLVKALQLAQKPLVLYVGPRAFYEQAHIPDAEFIGATAKSDGLELLRRRAASLKKDAAIVMYCGCCPWDHCPNIRPAFDELHKSGFTNVKVLYLAGTFGTSWVDKGFPTKKAQ